MITVDREAFFLESNGTLSADASDLKFPVGIWPDVFEVLDPARPSYMAVREVAIKAPDGELMGFLYRTRVGTIKIFND